VVPSVNLEYTDDAAIMIKDDKGYTSQWVEDDDEEIEWEEIPPAKVKCIADWASQTWVPWDEGL
jgi:alpha-1,3-mannosyltransferase